MSKCCEVCGDKINPNYMYELKSFADRCYFHGECLVAYVAAGNIQESGGNEDE